MIAIALAFTFYFRRFVLGKLDSGNGSRKLTELFATQEDSYVVYNMFWAGYSVLVFIYKYRYISVMPPPRMYIGYAHMIYLILCKFKFALQPYWNMLSLTAFM